MAVEVLAGPVVTHRGAGIGMAGSALDSTQVHARIEHGRHEGMPEHMRVWPGNSHPAVLASRLSRRVAAWRSIRAPRE